MISREDIEHLATLARVAISPEEGESLARELGSVLGYVSEVSKIASAEEVSTVAGDLRNVMRDDVNPYPGGEFSEAILANAPGRDGNYVKVKQIF